MSKEKLSDLDFEVYREPWNRYGLKDHSTVKSRIVLQKVLLKQTLRADGSVEKKEYGIEAQTISVVYNVPEELKGSPSTDTLSPTELASAIVQDDIGYDTLAQEWNEYIVEDGTKLKFQLAVVKVSRTSRFDKYGNPIYVVQTGMTAAMTPKTR